MKNTPIPAEIVDKKVAESGISSVGKASIREVKRLINESIMMHHCVWSYYDRIQNDICAIYSYMDETGEFDVSKQNTPKRYTIEFVFNPRINTYEIRQIQTAYDRYGGELLREHILSILKEKNYAES